MSDRLNPKRTLIALKNLRWLTGDPVGAQRLDLTKTRLQARTWLQRRVKAIPDGVVRVDDRGTRFGQGLFGSSAFAGAPAMTDTQQLKAQVGVTQAVAWREVGGEFEPVKVNRSELKNAAADLELPIELWLVPGSLGVEDDAINFHGLTAHLGSMPMNRRRDALLATATTSGRIDAMAERIGGGGCKIRSGVTKPGIVASVVRESSIMLDQKHVEPAALARRHEKTKAASERYAREGNVTESWARIWPIAPRPFQPELMGCGHAATTEACGVSHRQPSGAPHDAAGACGSGGATAMLVGQSLHGISSNKIGDSREKHLQATGRSFDRLADKTEAWIASRS